MKGLETFLDTSLTVLQDHADTVLVLMAAYFAIRALLVMARRR